MIYELHKTVTTRYVLLLLLGAVLANGILFYSYCTDDSAGFSLQQIQQKYSMSARELEEENQKLFEWIFSDADVRDDALLTGDVYREYALNNALLARHSAAETYLQLIQRLQEEAALKRILGLFDPADTFSAQVLLQTEEIYHSLETIQVKDSFSGAAEPLSNWGVSNLFVLLFGFIPGLLLMTQERSSGLSCLLQPTKFGHSRLYFRKFGAMILLLLIGFATIYGVDFAIAGSLFGFGPLSRPIQSVYGFAACPLAISVVEYLLMFLGGQLLWCGSVSALFFLLSTCTSKVSIVLFGSSIIIGLTLQMGNSSNLWFRAASLSYTANAAKLFQGCMFLNFAGRPIAMYPAILGFLAGFLCLSSVLGCVVFCKQSAAVGTGKLGLRIPCLRSTNHFVQEGWKIMALHGGLAALVLFSAVQYMQYQDFYIRRDSWEVFYRTYSQQLSGAQTSEKEQWLEDESERYAQIHLQLSETTNQTIREELEEKLRPEKAYQFAAEQYRALKQGQSYIYTSGYDRLYNAEGIRDDLTNTAKLFLVLIVVFSGIFAVEQESGVQVLQVSAGKQQAAEKRKYVHAFIFVLIAAVIAYIPQYITVTTGYGLPELSARANSLEIFSALPDFVSIRGLLILTNVIRVVLSQLAGRVILCISKRTGNTIISVLISSSCLLLPIFLVIII